MRARLMAVGGFVMALGYALIMGSPSIASLVYGANSVGGGAPISTGDGFTISIWLLGAGLVLLPVGVAVLVYGAATKAPPEAVALGPAENDRAAESAT